jgi:hypothetical protein
MLWIALKPPVMLAASNIEGKKSRKYVHSPANNAATASNMQAIDVSKNNGIMRSTNVLRRNRFISNLLVKMDKRKEKPEASLRLLVPIF